MLDELFNKIVSLYKQSVRQLPLLRYSWVVVATICILALAGYFRLKNTDVFVYALALLGVCLISFVFSYLFKNVQNRFLSLLVKLLITSIISVMCAFVLGFGWFIFTEKPKFFYRILPPLEASEKLTLSDTLLITNNIRSMLFKTRFGSNLNEVISNEWSPDSINKVTYDELPKASECLDSGIKYIIRRLNRAKVKDELFSFLDQRDLLDQIHQDQGYLVYAFKDNALIRISLRIILKPNIPKTIFVNAFLENSPVLPRNKEYLTLKVNEEYYIIGSSFEDGNIFEIMMCNKRGFYICSHDWWNIDL